MQLIQFQRARQDREQAYFYILSHAALKTETTVFDKLATVNTVSFRRIRFNSRHSMRFIYVQEFLIAFFCVKWKYYIYLVSLNKFATKLFTIRFDVQYNIERYGN